MSIFITQLIYIRPGQEETFHRFEDAAIPAIARHNGRLVLRLRPTEKEIIETAAGHPYEVHLVEFGSEEDLQRFMQDEERKKFIHLKEQSVESMVLLKGARL